LNNFRSQLFDVLNLLESIEKDLNVIDFSPNEKQVLYSVAKSKKFENNISDIVHLSGLSRSSVYKTLKKLVEREAIHLIKSENDKREFLVKLS